MASLTNLFPGQVLAVFYEDDTFWHERLVLWRLSDKVWYILTPDGDLYPENLACEGGDGPNRVKVKGIDFKYWSRVGGRSYRFAKPLDSDAELRKFIKQAYKEAEAVPGFEAEWRPSHIVDVKGALQSSETFLSSLLVTHRMHGKGPGLRAGGGVEMEVIASDDGAASVRAICLPGPSKVWVVTEQMDGHMIGEMAMVDPAKDLMIGPHTGLIKVPSGWMKAELVESTEAPDFIEARRPTTSAASLPAPHASEGADEGSADARTLLVDYDNHGIRYKEWRSVAHESKEYGYPDWPHEGPATVLHMVKHMLKFGGDPKLWLELWCRQKSISEQDRVKHELRCLMEVLYYGGTYDQLNMPVLASFESVARRVQCIVNC